MRYTEKDVENAIKNRWTEGNGLIFIGQQVRVPVGIIDLLFFDDFMNCAVVVEVKKGKAPPSTLAQIYGYINYIHSVITGSGLANVMQYELPQSNIIGRTRGIICAEYIDDMTSRAIYYGEDVSFMPYQATDNGFTFDYSTHIFDNRFDDDTRYVDPSIGKLKNLITKCITYEAEIVRRDAVNNPGGIHKGRYPHDYARDCEAIWKR